MAPVNIDGIWKDGSLYANINGTWKEGTLFANIEGTWKEVYSKVGVYTLLADITVASATTSVNFTGLTMTAGEEYLLVSDFVSPLGAWIGLYVNGNNTATNYYYQTVYGGNTSFSSARGNSALFLDSNTSDTKMFGITRIKLTNSSYYISETFSQRAYGSSSCANLDTYCSSTFTLSSITSIAVTASSTNGIGAASRFQLYKIGGA